MIINRITMFGKMPVNNRKTQTTNHKETSVKDSRKLPIDVNVKLETSCTISMQAQINFIQQIKNIFKSFINR